MKRNRNDMENGEDDKTKVKEEIEHNGEMIELVDMKNGNENGKNGNENGNGNGNGNASGNEGEKEGEEDDEVEYIDSDAKQYYCEDVRIGDSGPLYRVTLNKVLDISLPPPEGQ